MPTPTTAVVGVGIYIGLQWLFLYVPMNEVWLFGLLLVAIAVALVRVRAIILERERHTEWVKHAVE